MGYPRQLLVPPDLPGTYHCVSRCVRRAYLCGQDALTGRSFEHRKQWLEQRIIELGSLFAVAVHAYAVMSNHLHVVLEVSPCVPHGWSDEEVARRWLAISGADLLDDRLDARIGALKADGDRLAVLRERLGSLSWFMRFLKEPIARLANKEDGCTGRFWEGRFKVQALLDDPAVLACMVYVDLNPVRAGVAESPSAGPNTSLRRRSLTSKDPREVICPVASSIQSAIPPLTLNDYLELVDWTFQSLSRDRSGLSGSYFPSTLRRLRISPDQWVRQVPSTESRYWRAIGKVEALLDRARSSGQNWFRGIGFARRLQLLSTAP